MHHVSSGPAVTYIDIPIKGWCLVFYSCVWFRVLYWAVHTQLLVGGMDVSIETKELQGAGTEAFLATVTLLYNCTQTQHSNKVLIDACFFNVFACYELSIDLQRRSCLAQSSLSIICNDATQHTPDYVRK